LEFGRDLGMIREYGINLGAIIIFGQDKGDNMENKRRQINIRLEQELYEFLVRYSKENFRTVTATVREMIANLYKENKVPLVIKNDEK
jgi:hypothetical protein